MKTLEEDHQIALMTWAKLHQCLDGKVADWLIAIPNGGHRHKKTAARLKAAGVKAGVSDLFLALPLGGFAGLWIELKAPKSATAPAGTPTQSQIDWLDRMAKAGYLATVCVGWESARDTIVGYLGGRHGHDTNG